MPNRREAWKEELRVLPWALLETARARLEDGQRALMAPSPRPAFLPSPIPPEAADSLPNQRFDALAICASAPATAALDNFPRQATGGKCWPSSRGIRREFHKRHPNTQLWMHGFQLRFPGMAGHESTSFGGAPIPNLWRARWRKIRTASAKRWWRKESTSTPNNRPWPSPPPSVEAAARNPANFDAPPTSNKRPGPT